MVTLALPDAAVGRVLDGSGHLVPKPAQRTLTAASWASTKWSHWRRPGQVVVRASAGRWGDEHAMDLDDGDLVAAVMLDLERHLGVDGAPTATRVTRWPRSFPQYAPGHLDRVADLERRLAVDAPGIVVAGAAYRGLGIPACIRQGREWAEATMQHLPA
jgi:oxygen-dependent protoporphyrinogen oxidase